MIRRGIEGSVVSIIRNGLAQDIRLDGRSRGESRVPLLELWRSATEAGARVAWGSTLVCATISATLVKPYSDRAGEGMLQLQADSRVYSLLDRAIRTAEVIDLESLCVLAGERVWSILCSVRILDAAGGNLGDASLLAAVGALRAYRKPEVQTTEAGWRRVGTDEREALPLALHYSPLAVTICVCLGADGSTWLVLDPLLEEQDALDGQAVFVVNSHGEICLSLKPGGAPLSAASLIGCASLAVQAAVSQHSTLDEALRSLELRAEAERDRRLQLLRAVLDLERRETSLPGAQDADMGAGIAREDALLEWDLLHQASIST